MTDPFSSNNDTNEFFGGKRYAWYALGILTLVQAMSIIDRQIVTILAGEIKRDFSLTDSEIGLIYGTLFAIFYALFGIPLGRLADNWIRTRVIGFGVIGWSLMGMCSGLAANVWQFALTRVGVGIGEACAGPAATSLISDYFPSRLRATALAIFACGVSLGVGFSLWMGGSIVDMWSVWHPDGNYTLGLAGWQVSFIVVALPGFLLSGLVLKLREPPRDLGKAGERPFLACWQELKAVLPGVSLVVMIIEKTGARIVINNLIVLSVLIVLTALLVTLCSHLAGVENATVIVSIAGVNVTSHWIQWSIVALGLYCVYTWSQTFRLRDPASHELICRSPSSLLVMAGGAASMTMSYGVMAWTPQYAVHAYDESLSNIGLKFGSVATLMGIVGTLLGGFIGDKLNKTRPSGRLYVTLIAVVIMIPAALFAFTRPTFNSFLLAFCLLSLAHTAWLPGVLSTMQDLVLPRMRGLIYATYYLVVTIAGLGSGPYVAGLVSDVTGNLRTGIMSLYLSVPVVCVCFGLAIWRLQHDIDSRQRRAQEAGEMPLGELARV